MYEEPLFWFISHQSCQQNESMRKWGEGGREKGGGGGEKYVGNGELRIGGHERYTSWRNVALHL